MRSYFLNLWDAVCGRPVPQNRLQTLRYSFDKRRRELTVAVARRRKDLEPGRRACNAGWAMDDIGRPIDLHRRPRERV